MNFEKSIFYEEVTIRVYLFLIIFLGYFLNSCASRHQRIPNRVVAYTDLFAINRVSTKSYPQKKQIDQHFKAALKSFIKDAQRYGRLNMTESRRLRGFKFSQNDLFRSQPGLMASCFAQQRLVSDLSSKGLKKPGEVWLEIEVNKQLYDSYVGNSKKRAKYVAYHLLFHCFYQEGHLPSGHVGIMEDDFYDPRDTRYQKTDEQLVRELFSDKSFDILPDTR